MKKAKIQEDKIRAQQEQEYNEKFEKKEEHKFSIHMDARNWN